MPAPLFDAQGIFSLTSTLFPENAPAARCANRNGRIAVRALHGRVYYHKGEKLEKIPAMEEVLLHEYNTFLPYEITIAPPQPTKIPDAANKAAKETAPSKTASASRRDRRRKLKATQPKKDYCNGTKGNDPDPDRGEPPALNIEEPLAKMIDRLIRKKMAKKSQRRILRRENRQFRRNKRQERMHRLNQARQSGGTKICKNFIRGKCQEGPCPYGYKHRTDLRAKWKQRQGPQERIKPTRAKKRRAEHQDTTAKRSRRKRPHHRPPQ